MCVCFVVFGQHVRGCVHFNNAFLCARMRVFPWLSLTNLDSLHVSGFVKLITLKITHDDFMTLFPHLQHMHLISLHRLISDKCSQSAVDQYTCVWSNGMSQCVSSGLTSSATRAGFGCKACCSAETILQEHVEICVLCLGACPLCTLLSVSPRLCHVGCAVLRLTLRFMWLRYLTY